MCKSSHQFWRAQTLILYIHRKNEHSGEKEKEEREGGKEGGRKESGREKERREEKRKKERGRMEGQEEERLKKKEGREISGSLSAGQALALDYQVGQQAGGRRLGLGGKLPEEGPAP